MEGLNNFEKAVLAKLFAGDHPLLAALRCQAEKARLVSRNYTGAGFYCAVAVPSHLPPLPHLDFQFGDVNAKISGLKHGAGFVVFVSLIIAPSLSSVRQHESEWRSVERQL